MTLNQLVYFWQLAHTQHYGYAAEQLFVSQPSISRAIAQLEDELDVELFAREGRNVVLTRAGHVFLEYVEQSLDTLNRRHQPDAALFPPGGSAFHRLHHAVSGTESLL